MTPVGIGFPANGDPLGNDHYIGAIAVLTAITISIAWLRIYTRVFVSHNTGLDDGTILGASLMTIIANTFLMNSYDQGLGITVYHMTENRISLAYKWLWAAKSTNLLAVFLVKVSICLSFLRLVPRKGIQEAVIYALITSLVPPLILMYVNCFFECRPIQKVWVPSTPGTCFGEQSTAFIAGFYQLVSVTFDLVLLIIPIGLFWKPRVGSRVLLALFLICGVGAVTCAWAIMTRFVLPNLFSQHPDWTSTTALFHLWAPTELCLGMIYRAIQTSPTISTFWSERYRQQDTYQGLESSYELTDVGIGSSTGLLQAAGPSHSTDKNKEH